MCGIVGYIDGSLGGAPLDRLLSSMVHRGPDGAGDFHDGPVHMGMRRLSIIDLATGWQPLTSCDGDIVAFQNGEIYNYKELRAELEALGWVFRTQGDTEVLAHGYAAWSIEGLLERVDGMYALAILDRRRRELHLARDRFGEKPLFIAAAPGRFGYGSSLLAVAALPWVTGTVDPLAVDDYLAFHYVCGNRTILADVRRVLPGERVTVAIDDPVPVHSRYYRPPLTAGSRCSDDDLAAALEAGVVSRLVADVPVGVFLSGGIDSSVVAAIAARHQAGIATFSMGFGARGVDESHHARAVAAAIGSRHHEFLFDQDRFLDLLGAVAGALDEPIGDQAMLPVYWLSREARRHVTVVLSGEGADEVFGGYDYYRRFLRRRSWRDWCRRALGRPGSPRTLDPSERLLLDDPAITLSGFPLLANGEQRQRLTGRRRAEDDPAGRTVLDWLSTARDLLQRATATDVATWLPDDLLVKFDRMTMAHSLEGRAPYLSPRVVELGLNLPPDERATPTRSKVALRRIARRYLPADIVDRPKQGFVLPMRRWIGEWFERCGGAPAYLRDRDFPGLDAAAATRLITADLEAGLRRERLLFALVMLLEWWRSFQDRRARLRLQ